MSRHEQTRQWTEWAVRRHDGRILAYGRDNQGRHDAEQAAGQMVSQAERLGLTDYRATVIRRTVTETIVTTRTATRWDR